MNDSDITQEYVAGEEANRQVSGEILLQEPEQEPGCLDRGNVSGAGEVTPVKPSMKTGQFLGIALLLVLVTFAVYWPVIRFPFVAYDDEFYVFGNPQVMSGLTGSNVAWAFSTLYQANWHPLTWLSHQADVSLFGLFSGGHHLTNLIIHCTNTVLLLLLFSRFGCAVLPAAAVAALFALHPLHVESVAWISERKDLLCAFFTLLTLLAYVPYAVRGGKGRMFLVMALFACALMAKPMAVTLPILLLLLDWWPLGRFRPEGLLHLVNEKIPLFAMAMAASALTVIAQNLAGAVATIGEIGMAGRLANALVSSVTYLEKAVWPTGLAPLYPLPLHIPWWQVCCTGLVLLILATGAVVQLGRRPWLAFGLIWFLVMLLPVLGLVQVGKQGMADRYTYLSLTGVFVAACWGMGQWSGWKKVVAWGALAGLVVFMAQLTRQQTMVWRSSESLFRSALTVTRDNYIMHHNLGDELTKQGRLQEAAFEHEQGVAIVPNNPRSRYSYGNALYNLGKLEEATVQYRMAITLNPDYSEAHYNLGVVCQDLGRRADAIFHYREALRLDPEDEMAREGIEEIMSDVGHLR